MQYSYLLTKQNEATLSGLSAFPINANDVTVSLSFAARLAQCSAIFFELNKTIYVTL